MLGTTDLMDLNFAKISTTSDGSISSKRETISSDSIRRSLLIRRHGWPVVTLVDLRMP